ncbi:DNA-protecting protein DprA [Bacillus sp. V3B]|uniref:DNA-processing protein DprA n=1 Tax=Bacillus sp. V3B TaxID=2804915 RepID=UPI00210E619C|nr:DNA-processing protein DprA [Bacillus sp. V3B]MCQ6276819.1 DNA-protecting protein DprA [Bacillus sp. V3B]
MNVYWIWLTQITYIGPVLQKRLLIQFGSPEAVYFASQEDLEKVPRISKRAIESILVKRDLTYAEYILDQCDQSGVRLLRFFDELYPPYAKTMKESPVVLYYKGHLNKIKTAIGVVGSRRCTPYGRKVAEEIGRELALQEIPLISGFAKGIDSYTQAACINQDGYTAIFLASGVDVCYPPEQQSLYYKTLEKGSIFLSQYPPGTKPHPKHFLQRNALISAWSTEVVVVEANEKSGALWTANFARTQSKTIYAVPHPIHIHEGKGSNLLLTQGALPYLGKESLTALHGRKPTKTVISTQEDDSILHQLSQTPTSISSLVQILNSSESEILGKLLLLELEGKIIIRGNSVSLL